MAQTTYSRLYGAAWVEDVLRAQREELDLLAEWLGEDSVSSVRTAWRKNYEPAAELITEIRERRKMATNELQQLKSGFRACIAQVLRFRGVVGAGQGHHLVLRRRSPAPTNMPTFSPNTNGSKRIMAKHTPCETFYFSGLSNDSALPADVDTNMPLTGPLRGMPSGLQQRGSCLMEAGCSCSSSLPAANCGGWPTGLQASMARWPR